MAAINEAGVVSDWLKYEEPNAYSRETVTVASGAGKLATGTVLAKVTASGKYVAAAASGSDGTQTAVAVLVTPVDATSADQKAVVVARDAIVGHAGLTYGATINDSTKRATANGQLGAVGILVRESA
jgi:predicted metalloprotease with PDZ domain